MIPLRQRFLQRITLIFMGTLLVGILSGEDTLTLRFTGIETLERRDTDKVLRVDVLNSAGHEAAMMFHGLPARSSTRRCTTIKSEGRHCKKYEGDWTVCPLSDFEQLTIEGMPAGPPTIQNWSDFVPIAAIKPDYTNVRNDQTLAATIDLTAGEAKATARNGQVWNYGFKYCHGYPANELSVRITHDRTVTVNSKTPSGGTNGKLVFMSSEPNAELFVVNIPLLDVDRVINCDPPTKMADDKHFLLYGPVVGTGLPTPNVLSCTPGEKRGGLTEAEFNRLPPEIKTATSGSNCPPIHFRP
jgi:hypothetical protein